MASWRVGKFLQAVSLRLTFMVLAAVVAVCASALPQRGVAAEASAAALPAVRLDGNYFSSAGHPFIVVGTNWVSSKHGMLWPEEWDPKELESDFATMSKMGFNTVRLDLLWAWFEPAPNFFNPKAFEQFDYIIKLSKKYKIYLIPILFTGGEVGEAWWDVPWRMGRDPQSNAMMLYLETNFAARLAKQYSGESAILAWDLADEPPFWISGNTTDAMAVNWTRLITGAIRSYDRNHPIVVGTDTQGLRHGPFRPDNIADEVDFFSIHPYTIYSSDLFPDPMVSLRGTYGSAFATALNLGAGKPVMLEELGASTAQYAPEQITQFERTSFYSALAAGNNGFLPWDFADAAPNQYHKVPYLRAPHETQFGLLTATGAVKPQGAAFEKFARTVGKLDLKGLSLPHGEVGIVVPMEWSVTRGDQSFFGLPNPAGIPYVSVTEGGAVDGSEPSPYQGSPLLMRSLLSEFILVHQAGWRVDLPREQSSWAHYPVLMLPYPLTATEPMDVHLHTDFWQKAKQYVEDGGVLYASLAANSAIPNMDELFGARMTDSQPVSTLTLKVVKQFGNLKPGDELHFAVPGNEMKDWGTGLKVGSGEVIAVDQFNRPALVAHTLGKGKTLVSAYPLEEYLGGTVEAFERGAGQYRLFQAFRLWSGIQPLVSTGQPDVEAGALVGRNRGYLVLVNHSDKEQRARLAGTLTFNELKEISPTGEVTPHRENGTWSVDVPAYDGVVLSWAR